MDPTATPFEPQVGLTLLGRADEVPDTPNTAIILALWFVQLHAHPLATGKLRGPTEPQCARLRKQGRIWPGTPWEITAHKQCGGVDEGAPGSNLSSDITIYWLYDLTSLCLDVLTCEMDFTLPDCYIAALSSAINSHKLHMTI